MRRVGIGCIMDGDTLVLDDYAQAYSPYKYNCVINAHQRVQCYMTLFLFGNTDMLKCAFLTYVRPLLEYNSVIWLPCYKQDIEGIERVQRRFSKRLLGLKNL